MRLLLTRSLLLLSLAAAGETLSETAGYVRVEVAADAARPVSCPFADLAAAAVAELLIGDASDGDLLHVWVGSYFNPYQLRDGAWRIYGSDTVMPPERFAGSAWFRSRLIDGTTTIRMAGALVSESTVELTVGGEAWSLLVYPWPLDVALISLPWTGSAAGDEIRVWHQGLQAWQQFVRAGDAWIGAGSDTAMLTAAGGFLYYNAAADAVTLVFSRPF